jgi:Lrp/AsnC family transcriptional regulator for asnA, asnC and gidA
MIDTVDRAILEEYILDSRQSFREVARKTNVSPGTVAARVAKLEERGIIKKYTIQVDHEKLGYDLTVLINVRVTGSPRFFEESNEVAELLEPNAIYNTTGDHDLMIIAKFKNRAELSEFTKELLRLPQVQGTKTQLVLQTITEDFNKIR